MCAPPALRCPHASSAIAKSVRSLRRWWRVVCTSCRGCRLSGGAGWLPGLADSGWSNRLGWYEGFHLLLAVKPVGMITGCGFGPARTKEHPLAETFFARRRSPHPSLASVGAPACGPYVVDKGFEGQANHQTWWRASGAQVIGPPKCNSRVSWPKRLRR